AERALEVVGRDHTDRVIDGGLVVVAAVRVEVRTQVDTDSGEPARVEVRSLERVCARLADRGVVILLVAERRTAVAAVAGGLADEQLQAALGRERQRAGL